MRNNEQVDEEAFGILSGNPKGWEEGKAGGTKRVKGGCFRWSLRNGLSGCEAGSETKGSKGLSHTCGENSDCRWEQLTCSENGQEPAWLERGQCEAEQEMRSGGPRGQCLGACGPCGPLDSIQGQEVVGEF